MAEKGYHVFVASLPCRQLFKPLYDAFDRLYEAITDDPTMIRKWDDAIKDWQGERNNLAFYDRVPPGFKDREGQEGKRDKAYVQYCLDFAVSKAYRDSGLSHIGEVSKLFGHLEELHFVCVDLFSRAISSVCDSNENAKNRLCYRDRLSPVVFKLIRYNPDAKRFGTDPHYDKSALSLILNSDDQEVSYRVGPYKHTTFRYSELIGPIKYPASDLDPNDAVLVSGLCLREIGLDGFNPSPHSVLPITRPTCRHSIVAFYLAPFVNLDFLDTQARYVNDYDPEVS